VIIFTILPLTLSKVFQKTSILPTVYPTALMPEEWTLFQTSWKVGFTPLNYGQHDGDILRLEMGVIITIKLLHST